MPHFSCSGKWIICGDGGGGTHRIWSNFPIFPLILNCVAAPKKIVKEAHTNHCRDCFCQKLQSMLVNMDFWNSPSTMFTYIVYIRLWSPILFQYQAFILPIFKFVYLSSFFVMRACLFALRRIFCLIPSQWPMVMPSFILSFLFGWSLLLSLSHSANTRDRYCGNDIHSFQMDGGARSNAKLQQQQQQREKKNGQSKYWL